MALAKLYKWLSTNRISFVLMCLLYIAAQLYFQPDFTGTPLIELGVRIALGIGIAVLLQYLNRLFSLIKSKTVLPSVFWLLSLFAYTPAISWEALLLSLAFLLCLVLLFASYQLPGSQLNAFKIFIILAAACLLWYPALLLFPLIWYGMYRLQSFNLKTFSASIVSVFLVFLGLFAWSIYKNDIDIFLSFIPDWQTFIQFELPQFKLSEYIFLGFLVVLYIICIVSSLAPGRSDKVKTKTIFGYLAFASGLFFLFFFLFPTWGNTWLLLMFIPLSLLYSRFFSGIRKIPSICFFLFTVLFFIAKLVVNIVLPGY